MAVEYYEGFCLKIRTTLWDLPVTHTHISHCVDNCKTGFTIDLAPLDILKYEAKWCYKL